MSEATNERGILPVPIRRQYKYHDCPSTFKEIFALQTLFRFVRPLGYGLLVPCLPRVICSSWRESEVKTAANCHGRLALLMRLAASEEVDEAELEMVRERARGLDEVEEVELVLERLLSRRGRLSVDS